MLGLVVGWLRLQNHTVGIPKISDYSAKGHPLNTSRPLIGNRI
jgi:hypothetical protein